MSPFDDKEKKRKELESRIESFRKSEDQKASGAGENYPSIWKGFYLIGTLGFVIGISLMVGVGVGVYLDNRWHTKPWLTIVGILIGLAAAFVGASDLLKSSGEGQ